MPTIPQRELRNNVADILRRAEAGEEFVVTVSGRPVAQLGPHRRQRWVSRDRLTALTTDSPAPREMLGDLRQTGAGLSDVFGT